MSSGNAPLRIEVDESVFSLEVVLKAVYWLSGRHTIDVRRDEKSGLIAVLVADPDDVLDSAARTEIEHRLRRDLIDFRTREVIEKETRTLRDLLVAKAFANGDES